MNERIKELVKQATSIVDVKHEGYRGKGYTEQVEFFDKEKFAELIGQDAVNTLRKQWFDANNSAPVDSDSRLRAIHIGRKIGLMESVDVLAKHFGVER